MSHQPRILIAAPACVIAELRAVLGAGVQVVGAETWEQAVRRLHEGGVSLIVLCYVFDEMRPFRLVHYLQEKQRPGERAPIILVRALPVPLGRTEEAQIRESYESLGVDEFINLCDTAGRTARRTALQRFRDSVFARLTRIEQRGASAGAGHNPAIDRPHE